MTDSTTSEPSSGPTPRPDRSELLNRLQGGLVVSCQALPGEPLHGPRMIAAMARSAVLGGAAAVRVNSVDDIAEVRAALSVPVIGLWKDGDSGVYITPTLDHGLAVAAAGADIVAIDATDRPRPDGRTLAETIDELHKRTGALVMADVSNYQEGVAAAAAGADLVGTTLAGYTGEESAASGPDLHLLEQLAKQLEIPVLAEGRIDTPEQAAQALAGGAFAVVVGTAITRPILITARFAQALQNPAT